MVFTCSRVPRQVYPAPKCSLTLHIITACSLVPTYTHAEEQRVYEDLLSSFMPLLESSNPWSSGSNVNTFTTGPMACEWFFLCNNQLLELYFTLIQLGIQHLKNLWLGIWNQNLQLKQSYQTYLLCCLLGEYLYASPDIQDLQTIYQIWDIFWLSVTNH